MRVLDHFDRIVVLDDGTDDAGALARRLRDGGYPPIVVDIAASTGWNARFAAALGDATRAPGRGVLLLAPFRGDDRWLWESNDHMVERLEDARWGIAFLGHDEDVATTGPRPALVESTGIPRDIVALALPTSTLARVLERMPEHAKDGPLTPTEWLVIAAWLSEPLRQAQPALYAWPSLIGDVSGEALPSEQPS